jgi:putative NADH-flavin reductase
MKLVVLGATGGTGIEIVRQAIAQRHQVTAFVRSPERLKPFAAQIIVKPGERELKRLRKLDRWSFPIIIPAPGGNSLESAGRTGNSGPTNIIRRRPLL